MSDDFQSRVLIALGELQGGLADLRGQVGGLRGEVGGLRGRFADLQEGFAGQRAVLDRVEGKVDPVAAEMATMRPRVSVLGSEKATSDLRSAALHTRLDDHEVRLSLAERRLELRDDQPGTAARSPLDPMMQEAQHG